MAWEADVKSLLDADWLRQDSTFPDSVHPVETFIMTSTRKTHLAHNTCNMLRGTMNMDGTSFSQEIQPIRANPSFEAEDHANLQADLEQEWHQALHTILKVSNSSETSQPTTTTLPNQWFQQLYERHTEAGRHYHTVVHLHEMLKYLKIMEGSASFGSMDASVLRLAIFFHDAIYNPKSARNERESKELLDQFWKELQDHNLFQLSTEEADRVHHRVSTLILATEKHQVLEVPTNDLEVQSSTYPWSLVELQKIFLDVDMAVLGKEPEAYLAYAALVRKEYIHVPKDMYCSKRAEILQGFVDRPTPIFLTSLVHETLEASARKNLVDEVAMLKQGRIPGP